LILKALHPYERTYRLFNKQIHRIGEKCKRFSLPGSEGVPLYDSIWFFIRGIQKASLNTRASSIAFNFLLAIGPGVVFLLAMIPYLPIKNLQQQLFDVLNEVIPKNSYIAIESVLQDIFKKRAGLPFFGFLVSLFFAQKGINGILEAFNTRHHTIQNRSWFKKRLIAVVLVFIFYFLIITAAFLMLINRNFIGYLVHQEIIKRDVTLYIIYASKWIIIAVLTFFCISFLYYLAPQQHLKWKFFTAGSSLATILTLISSIGFSYFVNNFAQFNRFFGSIGALIALMLWINFNSLSLLIGFELNASITSANQYHFEQ
jgi:membrane protein